MKKAQLVNLIKETISSNQKGDLMNNAEYLITYLMSIKSSLMNRELKDEEIHRANHFLKRIRHEFDEFEIKQYNQQY